jgi:acyl-coenzyme A synthetase/AMP-(fatty) acid ligase
MPPPETGSLREALVKAESRGEFSLAGLPFSRIVESSWVEDRDGFRGRSALIHTADQLSAALALIDLDGLARRVILCPPGLSAEHLPIVARNAEVDAVVCSDPAAFEDLGFPIVSACKGAPLPGGARHAPETGTEWLLLTSGTTGAPKVVVHSLAGLTGAIRPAGPGGLPNVWATFYDIRRYGGLQILLRSLFEPASLVLSRPDEAIADHLRRMAEAGVTHVSGTPTHWRRVLMTSFYGTIEPLYVRLSGEIADQAILDALKAAYPWAKIGHAYASTEAGVGFEVSDGREGFPSTYLEGGLPGIDLKIEDGSLRIRSSRMASAYAGTSEALIRPDGFVDTGDMVEVRGGRCYFAGRRGGIINVGGLKVHPEEIEAVINRHHSVRVSRVKARKSPIIGAVVVAELVLKNTEGNAESIKSEVASLCRRSLPAFKVPAVIKVVDTLEETAGGKLARHKA